MDNRRAQYAVNGRRGPEAHGWVEVINAQARRLAVGVGDARFHADAIAHCKVFDLVADLDHLARSLVAEDHGLAHHEGADGAMGIVVDIAATNAHCAQRNTHVMGAERLIELNIAQRELALFFQYQRFHMCAPFCTEVSSLLGRVQCKGCTAESTYVLSNRDVIENDPGRAMIRSTRWKQCGIKRFPAGLG